MDEQNSTLIGRSLAHYRVMEKIGAGGMGVVYLAHDSHLNRPVALKVLRPETTTDIERKKRFVQEARAASTLNHANIVTIYDISSADGTDYIAMEYVPGKTLAQILREKRLSLGETLNYAIQITGALSRAHKAGIIHRDLKPANIMISEEASVKILDFGLAKLTHPEKAMLDLTTETNPPQPGEVSVAGTPAYMSPEQVLGNPVDARSDIFAAGIILFQCLTGRLPFGQAPDRSYHTNLLWGQPLSLRTLAPEVPEEMEIIVNKCLEKNPADRFESADSLTRKLQIISSQAVISQTSQPHGWLLEKRRMRHILPIVALLIVGATASVSYWIYRSRIAGNSRAPNPTDLTSVITWSSDEFNSRISPDGKWISFISNHGGAREIWLRNLARGEAVAIPFSSGNIFSQCWSPSSDEIACLARNNDRLFLQIVPAFFGDTPRISQEVDPTCTRLIRWIGDRIYLEGHETIVQYNLKTRTLEQVLSERKPELKYMRYFDVRRDERKIAFTAYEGGMEDLWIADLSGKNPQRLTQDAAADTYPLWVESQGPNVIFQSSRRGQLNISVVSTENRSVQPITSSNFAQVPDDISQDRSILTFMETKESGHLWGIEPMGGKTQQLTADSLSDLWPACSGDGRSIAFQRRLPSAQVGYNYFESQILAGRLDSGGIQNARTLAPNGYAPRLSSSGRWLAHSKWITTNNNYSELWAVESGGQRRYRITERCPISGMILFPLDLLSFDYAWSRETEDLYYIEQDSSGTYQICRFRADYPEAAPEVIVSAPASDRISELNVSREGRRLSYVQDKKGNQGGGQLRVRDLISGQESTVFTAAGDSAGFLFSRGFLSGAERLLVLPTVDAQDQTQSVTIVESTLDGKSRQLARLDHAFGVTAKLDPVSQTVYLTMAEGNIHNIYAFSIPSRKVRRLTENTLPGVSYSGISILPDGKIICSRMEKHGDIHKLRLEW